VLGQSALWSEPDPEPSDRDVGLRTFVARATGATLRRTTASLGAGDGRSLIVLTVVSTADAAYPVRDPTERLNEVEATAQLGSWSWDIEKDVVSWSDELYRIYGLAPQSMPITYEAVLELLHPDDRGRLNELVQRCYQHGDGAQQRLAMVEMTLRAALRRSATSADPALLSTLDGAVEELSAGTAELRSLARGLHPALLTERGLLPALQALASRSQVPVTLQCDTIGRADASVESAAYFVVSEALTNVMRHAHASHVDVTVQRRNSILTLEVRDDGSGGASIDAGSGLRGLADRVAALGGRLMVDSPSESGTLVRVELPCG
jgi:signal transduction histidine kinase